MNSKLKIEKVDGDLNNTNNIRTTISEFQITDEDGIKYVFKDAELSQVCIYDKKDVYNSDGTRNFTEPTYFYPVGTNIPPSPYVHVTRGNTKNAFIKSRWYLSEIINPLSNTIIKFEYEDFNVDMEGHKTSQINTSDNRPEFNLLIERIKGTSKRLKKIVLSTKEVVEFVYSNSFRIDVPTDKKLDAIIAKYDGTVKLKWQFETGYFVKKQIKAPDYSFTTEDKAWARLCLVSVKKTSPAGVSEPPYSFNYYMGSENGLKSAVPPLFSFYQDAWGYYNPHRYIGASSEITEPFGDNVLPRAAYNAYTYPGAVSALNNKAPAYDNKSGVLKTILNPMGGSLSFDYETNYYVVTAQNYVGAGGLRVSKVTEYDGLDHSKDKITEYKYVKEDGTTTSAWGTDNHIFQKSIALRVYKKCEQKKYPALNFPELAIGSQKYWNLFSAAKGGAKMAGLNADEFKELRSGTPLQQSPVMHTVTLAVQQIIQQIIISIIIDLFTSDWADYTALEYSSDLYSSHNLLPFQYSRVEVINKLATDNIGKTVFEFTSPAETNTLFAIDHPTIAIPYSSKQRYAYWLYGLTKLITVIDKNGKTVKKSEYQYTPFKAVLNDAKFVSQKWIANKRTYDCPFGPTNGTSSSDINYEIYYPICGRVELASAKEYIYNANDEFTLSTTDYEYSLNNYQVKKVKANNSKGELLETNTYYPQDYTLAGVIQTMKDKNMLAVPVSSQNLITKNGTTKYVTSGSVSEFGIAANGDIKLNKTHTFRSINPIVSTSVPFNAAQLIPSATYYKETGNIIYNTNNLPAQVNSENGKVSTIYDYDNKIAIATVANAAYTDIAYTSFEAEGSGGWTFDPLKINEELSPTGRKCLKAASDGETVISRSIVNTKKYILAFWKKGDAPILTGGTITLLKSFANPATGYTYYEYELSNGTSINITNKTGSPGAYTYYAYTLDEIRLYPVEARMTTITVEPLMGKSSDCDANGRITYYEYDDLGRMVFVKDEFKNIVKRICYNYAGTPENCDNYFYLSTEKSGAFVRSNCSAGGGVPLGTFTYTVPQGRYSSLLSQADANAKAVNDVNVNGQAYADVNGTCCYPTFTYSGGISGILNQTFLSGSTVNFTLVFTYPNPTPPTYFTLGNIASCGRPTSTRTIPYYSGSTLFNIIINSDGSVILQYISGPTPSGAVGLNSRYDLYANAFYSSAKSGNFTRNNCPPGQIGTTVTYSIQPYAYSSLIDQNTAEQLAQNALNTNGPGYANSTGTCNSVCNFTGAAGITFFTKSLSSNGTVITFDFVFNNPTTNYTGGVIGTIDPGCRPSTMRNFTVTDGIVPSRTWFVIVFPTGVVQANVSTGGPVTSSPPPIRIQGSFSL